MNRIKKVMAVIMSFAMVLSGAFMLNFVNASAVWVPDGVDYIVYTMTESEDYGYVGLYDWNAEEELNFGQVLEKGSTIWADTSDSIDDKVTVYYVKLDGTMVNALEAFQEPAVMENDAVYLPPIEDYTTPDGETWDEVAFIIEITDDLETGAQNTVAVYGNELPMFAAHGTFYAGSDSMGAAGIQADGSFLTCNMSKETGTATDFFVVNKSKTTPLYFDEMLAEDPIVPMGISMPISVEMLELLDADSALLMQIMGSSEFLIVPNCLLIKAEAGEHGSIEAALETEWSPDDNGALFSMAPTNAEDFIDLTEIIVTPDAGYIFTGFEIVSGEGSIDEDGCCLSTEKTNLIIKAVFEPNDIYKVIEGDNGKWAEDTKEGLSFRSNAEFAKFVGVEVDGVEVDPANYDAKEGSTIVTLKESYLNTLAAGEHTIGIVSEDGMALGNFTIEAKAEPAPTPAPTPDDEPTSPKTADSSATMAMVFVLAVAGIGATYAFRKKEF